MNGLEFNNIESLYDRYIIKVNFPEETFICPVCNKKFKTEKGATAHMEKKDCHSMLSLCSGTIYEDTGLRFCNDNDIKLTINTFRKSKIYSSVLKFIIFCSYIETDPDNLFTYLNQDSRDNFLMTLSKHEFVDVYKYRQWLQRNCIMIKSQQFYSRNKENLRDGLFLQRSIIKGKLSASYIFSVAPELIDNMENGLFLELSEFLDGV
jgi:hypothetical protein